MKKHPHHILYYSSDKLAALGLEQLLSGLPVHYHTQAIWSLSTVLAQCGRSRPQLLVFILHENMPLTGILKILYVLQQQFPALPVLVLTRRLLPVMYRLSEYLPQLRIADLKSSRQALRAHLLDCLRGETPVNVPQKADILLPDRQLRILLMMAWGYSTEQIGHRLGISHKTVNAHKLSALACLQVKSKNDMADLYSVIDELRMLVSWLRLQRPGREGEKLIYALEA